MKELLLILFFIPFTSFAQDSSDESFDIQEGWSMIAYTCSYPLDVASALNSIVENVIIVKDYSGAVYLPSLGFNGIGDFQYGYGYQIKTSQAVSNFQFCPEQTPLTPLYQIGDEVEGGIVFYLDETGQHGLVAATEDLDNNYVWGCFNQDVDGANSHWIGSGFQNSQAIVSEGCIGLFGNISAAQAAFDAEINGYTDWYLPSVGELSQMFITIGNYSQLGNIADFDATKTYISSTQFSIESIWTVYMGDTSSFHPKTLDYKVRVIRSF